MVKTGLNSVYVILVEIGVNNMQFCLNYHFMYCNSFHSLPNVSVIYSTITNCSFEVIEYPQVLKMDPNDIIEEIGLPTDISVTVGKNGHRYIAC